MSRPNAVAAYLASIGRKGGKASSRAKAAAARKNGKRGGRPRAKLPCIKCGCPTEWRDASQRPFCGGCTTL